MEALACSITVDPTDGPANGYPAQTLPQRLPLQLLGLKYSLINKNGRRRSPPQMLLDLCRHRISSQRQAQAWKEATGLGVWACTTPGERAPGPRRSGLFAPVEFILSKRPLVGPPSGLALNIFHLLNKTIAKVKLEALRNEDDEDACLPQSDCEEDACTALYLHLGILRQVVVRNELIEGDQYNYNAAWESSTRDRPPNAHVAEGHISGILLSQPVGAASTYKHLRSSSSVDWTNVLVQTISSSGDGFCARLRLHCKPSQQFQWFTRQEYIVGIQYLSVPSPALVLIRELSTLGWSQLHAELMPGTSLRRRRCCSTLPLSLDDNQHLTCLHRIDSSVTTGPSSTGACAGSGGCVTAAGTESPRRQTKYDAWFATERRMRTWQPHAGRTSEIPDLILHYRLFGGYERSALKRPLSDDWASVKNVCRLCGQDLVVVTRKPSNSAFRVEVSTRSTHFEPTMLMPTRNETVAQAYDIWRGTIIALLRSLNLKNLVDNPLRSNPNQFSMPQEPAPSISSQLFSRVTAKRMLPTLSIQVCQNLVSLPEAAPETTQTTPRPATVPQVCDSDALARDYRPSPTTAPMVLYGLLKSLEKVLTQFPDTLFACVQSQNFVVRMSFDDE
ncbi:hypothetical protein C8F01DRAFT_1310503 [Mycena amicta]|nr:hypothetical protein C8F01DRAFT_1310503 [Mycena amicta]